MRRPALTARLPLRSGEWPWALAALGFLGIALALRILHVDDFAAPYILTDELTYQRLAERVAAGDGIRWNGSGYGALYPLAIAPAWLADSNTGAYELAKAINVGLMSAVAIPVYLWGRRVAHPALAAVAVALTLALPAFVYTGTIMTENLFLPAFVLAAWAMARAVERPTVVAQVLVALALALAFAVRQQAVVLIVAYPLVLAVAAVFSVRARSERLTAANVARALAPYRVSLVAAVLAVVAYVVYVLATGRGLATALGAYGTTVSDGYAVGNVARWVVFHGGALSLSVGVVPVAALVVLLGLALRRSSALGPAQRAFAAVALVVVPLLVLQVGTFASRFALRVQERNLMHAMPLLLLALVVLVGAGLARPRRWAILGGLLGSALVLALPLGDLFLTSPTTDTFGLVPLVRLSQRLAFGLRDVQLVLGIAVAVVAVAFVLLRPRVASVVLPLGVCVYLALASSIVHGDVARVGVPYRYAPSVGLDADWVDRAVGRDAEVAFVRSGGDDAQQEQIVAWQTDFFNRSVDGALLFGTNLLVDGPAGTIRPAHEGALPGTPFLITASSVELDGRLLADRGRFRLWEANLPLRLATSTEGVFGDGWTGAFAAHNRFATPGDAGGSVLVGLSRAGWSGEDRPGLVTVSVGPLGFGPDGRPRLESVTATRTWEAHSLAQTSLAIPAPPAPFRVEIRVEPTFSPAEFGLADTRSLGVQVGFAFQPDGAG